jgi:hypothetical protein
MVATSYGIILITQPARIVITKDPADKRLVRRISSGSINDNSPVSAGRFPKQAHAIVVVLLLHETCQLLFIKNMKGLFNHIRNQSREL